MDLNYLYLRHQVALSASTDAPSREARASHRGLAAGYAARIARLRATNGGLPLPMARVS
ncbi:hypothetical protein M9979_11205 [Sphingomonas sp. RP10(2022)]|uniref:Uncharacterized protein n=1 Tax=Sphingomonas liriopis TaxID=2949094 RepID=A0A9X2HS08_9SPHN|nr:hypothetical protein [Sphingomonas liriopis]MCP3735437.1 hypothetical protein [Sphingomonas liriopis]